MAIAINARQYHSAYERFSNAQPLLQPSKMPISSFKK